MGWMGEALRRQPSKMGPRLGRAPRENPAMTQQERLELLACLLQRVMSALTGTDKVAHCLMCFVRYSHSGQLTGAVQPCQADCIAPVGFDPVTWTAGEKRWRHHLALMPQRDDLAIKIVPGRARLVTEVELCPALR